jgi:hypothetical protein
MPRGPVIKYIPRVFGFKLFHPSHLKSAADGAPDDGDSTRPVTDGEDFEFCCTHVLQALIVNDRVQYACHTVFSPHAAIASAAASTGGGSGAAGAASVVDAVTAKKRKSDE